MKRLLTSLLLAVLLSTVFAAPTPAAEPIGSVIGLQGQVEAVSEQGQSRALLMKSPIFMKDSLRTEAGARVQIMFQDDSLFSVGESSEVLIDEYVFNPNKKEDNNVVLRIVRGIARIITGKATDLNPDKFTVKTGRSTIGIRGCDLGFEIGPEFDTVYLVRIPHGREILITPMGEAGVLLTSRLQTFQEDGRLIQIWNDGRMRTLDITSDQLQRLGVATQPQALAPRTTRPYDWSANNPIESTAFQDGALAKHEVVLPTEAETESDDSIPTTPAIQTPDDPRVPPPPPPPLLTGGGIHASYSGSSFLTLNDLTVFHVDSGVLRDTYSDVNFIGRLFDGAGNFLGYPTLSLQNVPIWRYGSATAYEGYNTHTDPNTGGMVAHDNLGQFVRLMVPNVTDQKLLYWGTPAAHFAKSQLPDNSVVNYDVLMATYPDAVSQIPTPFQGIDSGTMRLNTKTGAYVVKTLDGKIVYGSMNNLRFYGQSSQGVGMQGNNPGSTAPQPDGMGLAGFRNVANPPETAESGTVNFQGYAAAVALPVSAGDNARPFSSADAGADTFFANEGRVGLQINKDDATFHSVDMSLNVYEDPTAPSPANQLHLGNPDTSFYVSGNEFGSVHQIAGQELFTQTRVSGQDWTWGEWNGTMEVPSGGGPQAQQVRGEFVAGRTLSDTEFQALAAGGTAYTLQTPSPSASFASAMISDGPQMQQIKGTCNLQVNIPGSGMTPTWSGNFNLSGGPDALNMTVNPTPISANGHLQGTPTTYTLTHGGNNYNEGTLNQGNLTGNLVGPGSAPTPITGAIGSGHFVHNNGITVNMTYGTELAP